LAAAEGTEPLDQSGEDPGETPEELDERLRRTREAHADAAEIVYGGIRAEACVLSGEIARDESGRLSLEPPVLEATATETGHVPADCPQTQVEQYMDKLSAIILGTCLIAGYGAAKADAWWSERRSDARGDRDEGRR
jgi:hypothetical protein